MVSYNPDILRESARTNHPQSEFYRRLFQNLPDLTIETSVLEISDTSRVNLIALFKGVERYVFIYDDESSGRCLRALGKFAANQDLNFTGYDAAVLSREIREERERKKTELKRRERNHCRFTGR